MVEKNGVIGFKLLNHNLKQMQDWGFALEEEILFLRICRNVVLKL